MPGGYNGLHPNADPNFMVQQLAGGTWSSSSAPSAPGSNPLRPAGPAAPRPQPATVSSSATTPVNPMQGEAYDAAKGYSNSLMSSTNEMVTRELGRARDEISVGMAKEGESAISRGADPSLFRTRALAEGQRGLHALQGRLADVNLGRQAEGIGLQTQAAGAAAGEQRLMHLGTMSQSLAEQRTQMEMDETQSRLDQAPYDRLMGMMRTIGGGVGYGGLTGTGTGTAAAAVPAAPVQQSGVFGRAPVRPAAPIQSINANPEFRRPVSAFG